MRGDGPWHGGTDAAERTPEPTVRIVAGKGALGGGNSVNGAAEAGKHKCWE